MSDSTKQALERFYEKEAKKAAPKRKKTTKRKSPEKEVEKEVRAWLEKQGFFFTVIEAKASTAHRNYGMRAVPAGFPDIVGVSPQGKAVYIELKSPQNKNGLSVGQYQFLIAALEKRAFAVHTWSVDDLAMKYHNFLGGKDLKQYLPKKFEKEFDDSPLFSDELFDCG